VKVTRSILEALDTGFANKRVLIVGDVMLDKYIWGEVQRISPEAPIPVVRARKITEAPGGAGNVAMNVVGLGAQAILVGYRGSDEEAERLIDLLSSSGVDGSGMVTTCKPTTVKTRILGRSQQLLRLDAEDDTPHNDLDESRLLDSAISRMSSADVLVLSDYAKGVLSETVCEALIANACTLGIPVLVDPKHHDFARYASAAVICPNLHELSTALACPGEDLSNLVERAKVLLARLHFSHIVLTMGNQGICLIAPDSIYHSPAHVRQVFDVSGAGDTVIAMLAACVACRLPFEEATDLANIAAGIAVSKIGTAPVSCVEVLSILTTSCDVDPSSKIVDIRALLARIARWRFANERIVFTNGCFDLLHAGHATLLQHCRAAGDRVVVGINSDSSVATLKGPCRPITSQNDRAYLVASLDSTDAVTIFHDLAPLQLIRLVRPDVLVKGGDYTVSTVVGGVDVMSWGGRVHIVPLVHGLSTTALIDRLSQYSASKEVSL
jgi:D-beta-D-heptose 7-phosphate kinase/D-beta-D-heptose 1-phosphate adenosyltransferase